MRWASSTLLAYVALTCELSAAEHWTTRFKGVTWDDDNWRITNQELETGRYQSRISLSNGYLGINLAALGPFFEADEHVFDDNINGWPLWDRRQTFATISGFYNIQDRLVGTNNEWLYQYGGESSISGIPHWGNLVVETSDGHVLNASTKTDHIKHFQSTLDVATAEMAWKYDWIPGGKKDVINIEYNMFVHKLYVNQAVVRLRITPTRDTNVTVYDILEGMSATSTNFVEKAYEQQFPTIYTSVSPLNITFTTAYIYSTLKGGDGVHIMETREEQTEGPFSQNSSSIAQSIKINMSAGETYVVEKFIGAASSDAFEDPKEVARIASRDAEKEGYTNSIHEHTSEWNHIMPKHSVDRYLLEDGSLPEDENIRELQMLSVLNPFQLLQNTVSPKATLEANDNAKLNIYSMPVCGLGSSCYGGLIFWDAEAWMAPGLQVSHPYSAKQIIEYRVKAFSTARSNIGMAHSGSQNKSGQFGDQGAIYPWASGRYGNCTGTGPCWDYEYHINGDIGIAMYNHLAVTGDGKYFEEHLLPVHDSIAYFFSQLLTYNDTSGYYELYNATDPDEFHNHVNNAGFTLALVRKHLNDTNMLRSWFGHVEMPDYARLVEKIRLPIDKTAGIVLEYTNMSHTDTIKQADIVLIDDMLNTHDEYSLANLDYYAAKQSPEGPGMTYAAFSIVANTISPSGCSGYTYDIWSSKPYTRAPWFQYSEQMLDDYRINGATHPAFPFLTGMGGSNRVAIFGYLGLQLFLDRLDIDPSLPPQIPRIDYRTFYWMGHGINATSNQSHTVLTRLTGEQSALPNANSTYFEQPIPVTFGSRKQLPKAFLNYNSPVVVANRRIGDKLTVGGNILQCKLKVTSPDPNVPGQFPQGAIDGAASTKWQPDDGHKTSWLTVDLLEATPFYPIVQIFFDWADQPPNGYEVVFSNTSISPPFDDDHSKKVTKVTKSDVVKLSHPFNRKTAHIIRKYVGNQTNVTLPQAVWSGRYVHLGIWGNQNTAKRTKWYPVRNKEKQMTIVEPSGDWYGATVAEWSLVSEEQNTELIADSEGEWSRLGGGDQEVLTEDDLRTEDEFSTEDEFLTEDRVLKEGDGLTEEEY